MTIHVECLPDETLLKKLGVTRKQIKHHQGKSRVFANIRDKRNQLAMVDEDPGSARHPYEQKLVLQEEVHGIGFFLEQGTKNKVFVLKIKLEDWIIATCSKSRIDMAQYGLPGRPNELHDVINSRLNAFEKLLDALLEASSPPIQKLAEWLGI